MVKGSTAGQRFVAYYRVSTGKQGRSGLGLEGQQAAVAQHVASVSGRIVAELVEVESGRKNLRPQLAAALAACRKHHATLLIAKLDRLARDVHFISGLMKSGVPFVAADRPNATPFELHIYAAMAEEEARAISARTKAALDAAKKRGVKLGGRRKGSADLRPLAKQGAAASAAVRREKAETRIADLAPIVREPRGDGAVTLQALADRLNDMAKGPDAQNLRPARGGAWSVMQVSRLLARMEAAE